MSTLEEWLSDPDGGSALRAAVGTDPAGRPAGILGNDELIRIIGNFPIGSLAAFPGIGITHQIVDTLLAVQDGSHGRARRGDQGEPRNVR